MRDIVALQMHYGIMRVSKETAPASASTPPEPGPRISLEATVIDTTIPKATRISRGIALFHDCGAEIKRTTANTYRVPSCTGEGSYLVYLDLRCCTCPDHARAKASGERCKHFHAAGIVAAKLRAARRRPNAS